MSDKDILRDAKQAFKLADDAEAENRRLWLEDVKFGRLGEQWPVEWKRKREAEGRPCLTINRMPSFVKQVTNDARQNKPAIKVKPVDDDSSEEVAEILDGLIRNIEYTSSADVAYDTALDHAVSGGFGYFRISTDYACDDSFEQDIKIERVIDPLTIHGDPLSTAADSSDWNVAFVSDLLKESEFDKRYPNAAKQSFDGDENAEDWFSEERIRIAEYWTREKVKKELLKLSDGSVMYAEAYAKMKDLLDVMGVSITGTRETFGYKVKQRIITGAEVLEENDWAGRYIPIIPVYGEEICIEGKRHFVSLIRGAKDSQTMFNVWRTVSTELVALSPKAPFIGPRGAFNSDAGKWATANTQTHAYIEYDGAVPPQRQPFSGVPAGALQEALNASDDMKAIMGIYDASLGAKSNETSGRAILARQREGDISTFNFVDNLSRAISHAGRVIVDLIPAVYNLPRMIRVLHEDGQSEIVPINKPFNPQQQQEPLEQGEPSELQEFGEAVIKCYDVTVGKYDVAVEAGPSFTTRREEASNQMLEFIRVFPQAAGIVGDLLAKNLDWPGADDIAERMKAMLPPQIQGQNPMVQQLQQQLQVQDEQAKQAIGALNQQIAQLMQKLEQEKADKVLEARKLDIDAFGKETDRLKAVGAGMNPQQVQAIVWDTLQQALASPDVLPQTQQNTTQQPMQPPQGGFLTPNEGMQQ
jgi:hypothetical protein